MSTTIEIPKFWTFHKPCCGAMFAAVVADQAFGGKSPNGQILATEQQAWDDFYDGRKSAGNAARKAGVYVKPSESVANLGDLHAEQCPIRQQ